MKLQILIGFTFLFSGLIAQNPSYLPLNENDTLPEKFRLKVSELRDHIYNGIPDKYSHSIDQRRLFYFADVNAVSMRNLVASGDVYNNWPDLEDYFNKILQKVMPEEVKADSLIHAYAIKDANFNAFMTPSGFTFIHVGLLTYIDDESSLAAIIAHELAHYYKRHSLKTFIRGEQGDFNEGLFIRNNDESDYSIYNESQADSLALTWLMAAGYELEGSGKAFRIMKSLQENALHRSSHVWEAKASTHPLPQERLDFFSKFIVTHSDYVGQKYLFGEDVFRKFQNLAREQVLKRELEEFSYSNCVEKAFKFHLLDPGNIIYHEYILEGIRRSCYMDPDLWNKNFVTHRYFRGDVERKSKYDVKPPYLKCLFESDDSFYLGISPEEHEKVKVKAYWEAENPVFRTNEEAFVFFYKIARKFGSKEAILSNALSVTLNMKVRDNLLKEYLAQEDIKYREYTEALVNRSMTSALPKKTMYVLSGFSLFLVEGKEQISIRSEKEKDLELLRSFVDTIKEEYKESPLIHLSDLNYYKLNDYIELVDLAEFAERRTLTKGHRLEFQILEPRFWTFFKKFGVNEIKFIDLAYVETRKSQKTVDSYKSALNIDFTDFFNQKKRTRELYISINSIRLQADKMMKIRYVNMEGLKFRKLGTGQISPLLIENFDEDIKKAKNLDRIYRVFLEEEREKLLKNK